MKIFKTRKITRQEKEAFTYGDCWVLALEMHKKCNLPVAFFIGSETDEDHDNPNVYWNHAFNVLPNGNYIDIHGVHTSEELHDRWAEELESGTPDIVHPSHHVSLSILYGETRHYSDDASIAAQKLIHQYKVKKLKA